MDAVVHILRRRVDLVRDPRCKPPDRFQLLRLPQLDLHLEAVVHLLPQLLVGKGEIGIRRLKGLHHDVEVGPEHLDLVATVDAHLDPRLAARDRLHGAAQLGQGFGDARRLTTHGETSQAHRKNADSADEYNRLNQPPPGFAACLLVRLPHGRQRYAVADHARVLSVDRDAGRELGDLVTAEAHPAARHFLGVRRWRRHALPGNVSNRIRSRRGAITVGPGPAVPVHEGAVQEIVLVGHCVLD